VEPFLQLIQNKTYFKVGFVFATVFFSLEN